MPESGIGPPGHAEMGVLPIRSIDMFRKVSGLSEAERTNRESGVSPAYRCCVRPEVNPMIDSGPVNAAAGPAGRRTAIRKIDATFQIDNWENFIS